MASLLGAKGNSAQQLAGALTWLATRTRPDIAYAVNKCSSCMTSDPDKCIGLAKRLLRYVQGVIRPFKYPLAKVRLHSGTDPLPLLEITRAMVWR